ncbi:MAG: hypothetical protein AAGH46_06890 [Bacteroidota bacterium]
MTFTNRSGNIIIHVLLPLLFAVSIYIGFRTSRLAMFEWLESVGMGSLVSVIRDALSPLCDCIPPWVVFSLPDGLWLYAFISMLIIIWGKSRSASRYWIGSAIVFSICSEVFQAFGWYRGTFDFTDLFMYAILGLTPLVTINSKYEIKT